MVWPTEAHSCGLLALLGRGCAGEALLAGCDGTVFLPGQPRFSSNGPPGTHQSSGNGGGSWGQREQQESQGGHQDQRAQAGTGPPCPGTDACI